MRKLSKTDCTSSHDDKWTINSGIRTTMLYNEKSGLLKTTNKLTKNLSQKLRRNQSELVIREGPVFHDEQRQDKHNFSYPTKVLIGNLTHPPHSLDLASSDYHLHRSSHKSLSSANLIIYYN